MNPICYSDTYKTVHWQQYPRDTVEVYSYIEARKPNELCTLLGLSYFLQNYFEEHLHSIKRHHVRYAKHLAQQALGGNYFNEHGWESLINKPLPVIIKAIPEGMIVPSQNVLLTIRNTDPNYYWLPSYLETLLMQLWYPSSVAMTSYKARQIILRNLRATGTEELVNTKLHDFGVRASTCMEQAQIGGFAHLTSFDGTDNLPAMSFIDYYYGNPVGSSVPASEHSTMTAWGKHNESDAYENMLDVYQHSPVSIVADSWNIYDACKDIFGEQFKEKILARDVQSPLVVRPDSGDPVEVTLKVIEILGAAFGFHTNKKGYKVLPPQVRILQGDGMTLENIERILDNYAEHGWSGDNIVFGMGGNLLQSITRDTYGYAFKCSQIKCSDGTVRPVYKDPVTDPGKKSKRGELKLVTDKLGAYHTVSIQEPGDDLLVTYYDNGIQTLDTLDAIRTRMRQD